MHTSAPATMKVIVVSSSEQHPCLTEGVLPCPVASPTQLLVKVGAAGVNRADILQRWGHYPPPAGESPVLGLEIAGTVVDKGCEVTGYDIGDRVFGLVAGGGYAEYCLLEAQLAIKTPLDWEDCYAAAIPEIFLTANETVFELGHLAPGESLLLHAALSGVGTAIIQMAGYIGACVYGTVSTDEKVAAALALGATAALNYKKNDFLPWILEKTEGKGVNLVQDFIGQDYFSQNVQALAEGGRLLQVATMSGSKAELDLRLLMKKRLHIIGSVMRSRSLGDKIGIKERFMSRWWPLLENKTIAPVIDRVYEWKDAEMAHQRMIKNENLGKIVLSLSGVS